MVVAALTVYVPPLLKDVLPALRVDKLYPVFAVAVTLITVPFST